MQFLRTPQERFDNLPDYDFAPNYVQISDARMHYVDTQSGNESVLMLHGEPSWAFLYRHMIHGLQDRYRCVAPDMLGFGRSDKPAEIEDHSFDFHYNNLVQFIEALDLTAITLIVQDWGGLIGLPYAVEHEDRIKRLVIMNTGLATGDVDMGEGFKRWQDFARRAGRTIESGLLVAMSSQQKLSDEVKAAYDAPFPDESYRAGVAAMPLIVPSTPDMPGAAKHRAARDRFASWEKPTLVCFSDSDPITSAAAPFFRNLIPAAQQQPETIIKGVGHFLQEEAGDAIARHITEFIARTP